MVGSPEPAGWAKAAVDQAKTLGILPAELQSAYDQPITRRDFCVLADALYTKVKGAASVDASVTFTDTTDPAVLGKPLATGEPTFADSGAVAGWARPFVGQMQQSGIMGGTGNNQFSPRLTYTREQSVVTIVRMFTLVK